MKLFASFSEAIREGAKLRPQAFGLLTRAGKSCAIGAGLEAIKSDYDEAELAYPYLTNHGTPCPVKHCSGFDAEYQNVGDCVWHLNDYHHWTRERIADWLETEEEKLGYVTVSTEEEVLVVSQPVSVLSQA